jgi:hypothetical protein
MKTPRYKPFVDKSVGAALSAIEIYNKPDFNYREETFAILMINAWELLLKGQLIKANGSKLRAIYEMTNKIGKKGNKLKTLTPVLNRSGNPKTIGLPKCLTLCNEPPISLKKEISENIFLLMEIRDAAIHFRNDDKHLSKKVFEIGTASLKNYLTLISDWFNYDLSKYNFYLMPISFFHEFEFAESYSVTKKKVQVDNLLKYIAIKEQEMPSNVENSYNISLQLETKFVKSSSSEAILYQYSNDPTAIKINVKEEDALKGYPFDYSKLTEILNKRYSDFKCNNQYHKLRAELKQNPKYCKIRYLDPKKKKLKREWFSSEIIKEFDKHYKKK